MNRRAQLGMGFYIMAFITIIVGVALMNQVINEQYKLTDKLSVVDEVVSVAAAKNATTNNFNNSIGLTAVAKAPETTDWQYNNCPLSGVVVTNASGTELTVTTDYTFNTTTGVLSMEDNSDTVAAFAENNNSLIDYNYCDDGYNTGSGSRGVARLFTLFMAMGIAFVAYAGMKQMGILTQ